MTMISESSYLSASSSHHTATVLNSSKLQKIETDVFNRIVNLKNQKIQLLTILSECIDRKHAAEADLIHHLEVKKRKEENLAPREDYRPVILRNIELKAEVEELERQVLERTNKSGIGRDSQGLGVGAKSRSKSVFDLSKSKQMGLSSHSRSKKDLLAASKVSKGQARGSNFTIENDDELIEQILEQRKLNNSLAEIIREQTNAKFQREPQIIQQQQTLNIKTRLEILTKLIQQKQQQKLQQKLSKTKTLQNSQSPSSKKSSQNKIDIQLPITYESDIKVQIKELLKYVQQEEEQKRLLYQELKDFIREMEDLREENQRIRAVR